LRGDKKATREAVREGDITDHARILTYPLNFVGIIEGQSSRQIFNSMKVYRQMAPPQAEAIFVAVLIYRACLFSRVAVVALLCGLFLTA
jgi:hypothetical protein